METNWLLAKIRAYRPEEDYGFLIYKNLSFGPGEIQKVMLTQDIPPKKGGVFSIDIAGFEDQIWRGVTTGDERAK